MCAETHTHGSTILSCTRLQELCTTLVIVGTWKTNTHPSSVIEGEAKIDKDVNRKTESGLCDRAIRSLKLTNYPINARKKNKEKKRKQEKFIVSEIGR